MIYIFDVGILKGLKYPFKYSFYFKRKGVFGNLMQYFLDLVVGFTNLRWGCNWW